MRLKKMKSLVVATGLLLAANNVSATGIPVVDSANLQQGIQQVLAWAHQYQQMLTQIRNMENNINALKDIDASQIGSRGLGYIYNNLDLIPYYSESWSSTLSNIKSSPEYTIARAQYPTSQQSQTNEYYDVVAQQEAAEQQFYTKSQARFNQISSLQTAINTASDPAAKADLKNRIAIEQANILASAEAFKTMQINMAKEKELAEKKAHVAFICNEFRREGCE